MDQILLDFEETDEDILQEAILRSTTAPLNLILYAERSSIAERKDAI